MKQHQSFALSKIPSYNSFIFNLFAIIVHKFLISFKNIFDHFKVVKYAKHDLPYITIKTQTFHLV